ncbi:GrpB family protein [Geodermatophilus sp. SYSU D00758]
MTGDREPITDEHLDRVTVGPRPAVPQRIVLVDPDPDWPRRFEGHRARIRAALGADARRVEHIGSTSVPGLRAKDRVDVLVAVADPEDPDVVARLEAAGYALHIREPGHRCLVESRGPDANVHVWADDDPEVERCLLFRDRLRADPADRARYQARKEELARQPWTDVNYYAEAKGDLIEEVLARARASRTGR